MMYPGQIFNKSKQYSLGTTTRIKHLWYCIEELSKKKTEGCLIEAGVYMGGCSLLMACALKYFNMNNRLVLFDTFKGMTKPSKKDVKFNFGWWNKCQYSLLDFGKWKRSQDNVNFRNPNYYTTFEKWKRTTKDGVTDWCYYPLEKVKINVGLSNYENIEYVEGDVLDTVPKKGLNKIELLRLDVDFYQATKHLMNSLMPLMQKDGFVIFDDYGCWKGTYDAVNEYFSENDLDKTKINKVDHSCYYYKVEG